MSNLLVIHHNNNLIQEQEDVLNQLMDWNIWFMDNNEVTLRDIDLFLRKQDIHFLIFSMEFDAEAAQNLLYLHNHYPLLQIIYYYTQFKSGEFAELAQVGINYCIIGDARQINLIKKLNQLWESHWRRIPDALLPEDEQHLTARLRQMIMFIETRPLRNLSTSELARSLKISESHLRIEFKRFFNISFREYKQKLFHHYESILLLEKQIKPKQVYEILNYKNISAFSRSFKSRHGETWQQLSKKTV